MDDLLKEAIADAKAVRETALENAKMALEEAFTPKLKSMLAQKIQQEIEGEDHDEDEIEDEGEGHDEDGIEEVESEGEDNKDDEIEEISMEDEEGDDAGIEEVEDETYDEEEDMDHSGIEDEGEDHDEDEMGEDLDLEAILAELEADITEEEEEDGDEEKVDENDVSSEVGKADNKVADKANDSSETGAQGPEGEGKDEPAGNELDDHTVVKEGEEEKDDEVEEDIDLEEVLKALSEEEDEKEDTTDEVVTLQAEIKEHRDVVKYLRVKLNEVNLLNAKLLFSNKLFRAFGLSNEQKLKVVETFDRTKNLREIKLVYSTLAESFGNVNVKPIKESKGSSSKPVASTKPANEKVLTEGNELQARFKKLANIL
jgi:hypothetical protein